jgi:GT2 family glycosyltransferase
MIERISAVVVNWNLKDDTLECINSLLNAGLNPEEIILIDNGSSDGSISAFENQYEKRIKLIKNPRNFGYTHAINQGIEQALSCKVEWIFLLNNDAIVSPDIFEIFYSTIREAPQYSIISPVIFYHADSNRIWFFGDQLFPGTLLTHDKFRNKRYNPNLQGIIPVDFVNGCGMLVNYKVFEEIGLFDPGFIMYGEEVDFCWRAQLAGFQMATSTKAHMWHKESLSAKRVLPQSRYLKIRNQIIFYRRYTFGLKLAIMFIFSTFRVSYLIIKDIINSQIKLIRPLILGWYAGWFIGLEQDFYTNEN